MIRRPVRGADHGASTHVDQKLETIALPRVIPVVINRDGGHAHALGDQLNDKIVHAFGTAGLKIDLHLVHGKSLQSVVDHLLTSAKQGGDPAPLIAVGGGDGSLGSVASLCARQGAVLAPLPLGTRNHFCRTLYGWEVSVAEVVGRIAGGRSCRVDLGTVNGRIFINNASIGFYPELVFMRERMRMRYGWPKIFANVIAAAKLLGRMPNRAFSVSLDGQAYSIVTPLLFLGNNIYSLDPATLGARAAMDDGVISVYAVERRTPAGHIGFVIRTLLGHARDPDSFALRSVARSVRIQSQRIRLGIALDGEVLHLATPLAVSVHPTALRVVA